jgi:hypothetical protein
VGKYLVTRGDLYGGEKHYGRSGKIAFISERAGELLDWSRLVRRGEYAMKWRAFSLRQAKAIIYIGVLINAVKLDRWYFIA